MGRTSVEAKESAAFFSLFVMLFPLLSSSLSHNTDLLWTKSARRFFILCGLPPELEKLMRLPRTSPAPWAALLLLGGSSRQEERLSVFCDLRTPLGQLLDLCYRSDHEARV